LAAQRTANAPLFNMSLALVILFYISAAALSCGFCCGGLVTFIRYIRARRRLNDVASQGP